MPAADRDLVLRSDDPRVQQLEAHGWEHIAASWGARLTIDPTDRAQLTRLRGLVNRITESDVTLREAGPDDISQVLALDALTAGDYPGEVAAHHEPLDAVTACALLEQGRLWGIWSADTLVALTATRLHGDRVETEFTAVHPAHRRRGLATAVKAASVLGHAQEGAVVFGTGGADSNVASLAMNEAVGYQITETWHTYRRRVADLAVQGRVTDVELNTLHAAAFDHDLFSVPWNERLTTRSLTWVTARTREDSRLVGFVNVIGDGGAHAVLLDTMVHPDVQGRGIGRDLVRSAAAEATRLGCRWLHADYEEAAADFYERSCGMAPTRAGLLRLRP